MKEFNLEAAKAGKPVCTRGGRPVRIICWDRKVKEWPIVALVNVDEGEAVLTFSEKGREGKFGESPYDLMMASEKKEGWINIFNAGYSTSYSSSTIYDTEENARNHGIQSGLYVTTIKIEWEE